MKRVPIGVSARHVHLSAVDLEKLFGTGYELTPFRSLSQPEQFAANETVVLQGPKGKIEKVRILGPTRTKTQVEISKTDAVALGISAPIRDSGNIEETPGIKLIGPVGEVEISNGVIVAARHIHLHVDEAREWNIADRELLHVRIEGTRGVIFSNVIARVSERFKLEMHLDTDEANAAGVKTGEFGLILHK